jgi:hypothetical protein
MPPPGRSLDHKREGSSESEKGECGYAPIHVVVFEIDKILALGVSVSGAWACVRACVRTRSGIDQEGDGRNQKMRVRKAKVWQRH